MQERTHKKTTHKHTHKHNIMTRLHASEPCTCALQYTSTPARKYTQIHMFEGLYTLFLSLSLSPCHTLNFLILILKIIQISLSLSNSVAYICNTRTSIHTHTHTYLLMHTRLIDTLEELGARCLGRSFSGVLHHGPINHN